MRDVTLRTSRLVIRDLPPRRASQVATFLRDNWDFHRPWEPYRNESYFSPGHRRLVLRASRRAQDTLHLWLLLPRPDRAGGSGFGYGPIVGAVTVSGITRASMQSCMLGYKIAGSHARQGYMHEALTAVLDYLFDELGLHRVEVTVMPSNTASIALAGRLGFRLEGTAGGYMQVQGRWEDHLSMALLSEERPLPSLRP